MSATEEVVESEIIQIVGRLVLPVKLFKLELKFLLVRIKEESLQGM